MSDCPLQFKQVTKRFPFAGRQIDALKQLDVSLKPGQITGLLGPDGAGKTTLLRLAAGLLMPDAGSILIFGADSQKSAPQIQADIGYMPQHFGLYEDLSVIENLNLHADLQGLSGQSKTTRQHELLKLTGLAPYQSRRAGALSGGMKQKLGLACALLRKPRLLLLDEPTVGVDPISRRELWHILQDIKQAGSTVLMSTAYFDEAERCDDIILLHEGALLKQQSFAEFRATLDNRTYLVNHATLSPRVLQQQLQARPEIIDARINADGIRVLCKDEHAHAMPDEHWQKVLPSFEDSFVTLLGKPSAKAQDTQATSVVQPEPLGARDDIIIEINELSRSFGQFKAVNQVSFQVKQGDIFGLIGANGAGKTTTFRMLCGLLPPTSGHLRVAGVDMRYASAAARARIGYVSQKFSLYGNLSVLQNLRFFAAAYGLRGKQRQSRIQLALTDFQLEAYQQINADTLPLGIKQRLALACALLHEPPILFLDEPTSGVDPLTRREFWQRIMLLADRGVTILVTTHFMDEAEYCDNLVLMSLGEILAQGTPQAIRAKARTQDQAAPDMNDAFIRLIQQHEGLKA